MPVTDLVALALGAGIPALTFFGTSIAVIVRMGSSVDAINASMDRMRVELTAAISELRAELAQMRDIDRKLDNRITRVEAQGEALRASAMAIRQQREAAS